MTASAAALETGVEPGVEARRQASRRAAERWAASGAMAISGPPPGATSGPPQRLVAGVAALGDRIEAASGVLGTPVRLDWLALLGERAALDGLTAGGRTSCGGATRLLPCLDGWIAMSLARPSDEDLVPAWLALSGGDPGDDLDAAVARLRGEELAAAAAIVGLPVGVLGERAPDPAGGVLVTAFGPAAGAPSGRHRVVDLSALWAGPLCGSLLAAAGAEVTKVEAVDRPDAARSGSPALYRLLNGSKHEVALDLTSADGRASLVRLVREADVVVESSRPRALQQLGLSAHEVLARSGGPQVWISITGHGRSSPRVAFGDDAAVAGGLVVATGDGPWFCADAVADPLTGLAAAAEALELLVAGERALVDVAMAGVAAAHGGPTLAAAAVPCAAPRSR